VDINLAYFKVKAGPKALSFDPCPSFYIINDSGTLLYRSPFKKVQTTGAQWISSPDINGFLPKGTYHFGAIWNVETEFGLEFDLKQH
jgi:hypothetical protein